MKANDILNKQYDSICKEEFMLAVKGIIQGNTVVVEDENLEKYNGKDVIVTILDYPYRQRKQEKISLDKFVIATERGENADEYVKELRENDRL